MNCWFCDKAIRAQDKACFSSFGPRICEACDDEIKVRLHQKAIHDARFLMELLEGTS